MSASPRRYSAMPITGQRSRRIIWGALWMPPIDIKRSSSRSEKKAAPKAAANRAGYLAEEGQGEGCRLRSVQQRPAARFLDRGPDPALSSADRAGGLGIS